MGDYQKVKRGQVFWFDPALYHMPEEVRLENGKTFHTNVQLFRRPYLVVSSDWSSSDDNLCNVAPITSSIAYYIDNPACVLCTLPTNPKNQNMILLNKIMTIDIAALGDYICNLSDNIMEMVDVAIARQFALPYNQQVMDINEVVEHLEKVVDDIIKSKIEQVTAPATKQQIEDAALNLAANIEMLTKDALASTTNKKTSEKKNFRGGKREIWSEEKCKQFLSDCEKMDMKSVAEKYGYDKINSAYSQKYSLQKRYSNN